MRQRATWQKLKSFGSFCLIMLLLPYIVTVFVHGKDFEIGNKEEIFVNVKKTRAVSGFTQTGAMPDSTEAGTPQNEAAARSGTADQEETQIVQVPWEEYFVGIMAREVPVDSEMEFLKAQAVLLRTKLYQELDAQETKILEEQYLTRQELEEKAGASERDSYYNKLLQAMQDTEDQVLFYQDTYALVPFHQSSNGMTRSAQEVLGADAYPYLAVRECPLDKEADDEMQINTFEYKDVQAKCQSFLVAVAEEDAEKTHEFSDFEIISHDSAGYVMQMRIGETICTGDQFRDALSLTSSAFSIKDADGRLRITTMGKGHGLGLSQWTARQMAKAGKNYEEILQFFFEGTSLADGGPAAEKIE